VYLDSVSDGAAPLHRGSASSRISQSGTWRLLAILALLVSTACVLGAPTSAAATNGGAFTSSRSWSVALVRTGSGSTASRVFCSGVLINSTHVLTAKHCLPSSLPRGEIRLVIGRRAMVDSNGVVRSVSRVVTHSSQDIAIITLSQSTSLTPIALSGSSQVSGWQSSRDVHLYGFGLWQGRENTGLLQEVVFRVNAHTTTYDLRARWSGRSGCEGDSGGPVISWQGGRPYLIGTWRAWSKIGGGRQSCTLSNNEQYIVMVGYRGSSSSSPGYNWVRAND
jgi:hypothetical protein